MPVVTIELPSALRTPLDAEMRQMWLDLLRWMSGRITPVASRQASEPPELSQQSEPLVGNSPHSHPLGVGK
jgi:hypothetical protein